MATEGEEGGGQSSGSDGEGSGREARGDKDSLL